MSGEVVVHGNAATSAAPSIRGGRVVVRGDSGPRSGMILKKGELIVGGNTGYMSGFMMQNGRMIVCGDAEHRPRRFHVSGRDLPRRRGQGAGLRARRGRCRERRARRGWRRCSTATRSRRPQNSASCSRTASCGTSTSMTSRRGRTCYERDPEHTASGPCGRFLGRGSGRRSTGAQRRLSAARQLQRRLAARGDRGDSGEGLARPLPRSAARRPSGAACPHSTIWCSCPPASRVCRSKATGRSATRGW